ncbi:hypothetical protein QQ045_022505 [Rhodiola kirilowii]
MTEEKELAGHISRHFRNLFSSSNSGNRSDWSKYLADVPKKLPDSKASYLCEPITELEVQVALFQMSPTKAPGLDGFSAIFFQKYWRVVRNTVVQKVVRMINEGKLEEGINETMIVLVPKCKKPKRVEEYRPRSLCNVVAKIITKVPANRLKEVLPEVILESHNILLAHELLHFIKTRRKQQKGYFSLKIDMSKAYDRIEWNFLAEMQRKMGFPEKWINMVMQCVTTVKYKVRLNDYLVDIPSTGRGLRQGDPISPYLFLLCSEWLSMRIEADIQMRRMKGTRICRGAPVLSHLFFADDSIFFLKATKQNARVLKANLEDYETISGQKINFDKSEIVFSGNVQEEDKMEIIQILGVKETPMHTKYLGLPIVFSNNRAGSFKFIIDSTWKR